MADVFLNGKIIGFAKNPEDFVIKIKEQRRKNVFPSLMSLAYNKSEEKITILTENGRPMRPLIVVKDGKPNITKEDLNLLIEGKLSWDELIKRGIVEYLDAEEEENTYVALREENLTKHHTHLEISPLVIFGPHTAMIPYLEHNSSNRVLIGAKTLKQGLGLYVNNFPLRIDTDVSILHYPQEPLVQTKIYKALSKNANLIGQNVIVAIMSYKGYNMQDAIIVNQSSIERGLFRSTYYRPYKSEELRYAGGQIDKIETPDKDVVGYRIERVYRYLEDDGIIYPEAKVNEEDVLIGKTSPPRFLASLEEFKIDVESRRETSIGIRPGEKGIVDSIVITKGESGNRFIKIKVRDERIPELGDKFASRHGQKGVIGLLVKQEDMPFSASGIVPDIIFSPDSIPSRMTIGHLIELIGAKVAALRGAYVDGTAFTNETEETLRKYLKEIGFRDDGSETFYDGETGQEYTARIMVGNVFYLKLRHMVANKIHARARGPVQLLTRQPTEGRSKEGGLRLGEMEKDCFVAHGAALLLKERFDSDKAIVPVCKQCGLVAVYNEFRDKSLCPVCGEDAQVTFVELSYAFKLLLDELKSLCIYPKIYTKPAG